jgi:hypothetical protein
MEVSGQRHAPAALYPGERTPPPPEGWVGVRAGLDTEARGKIFSSTGDQQTPVVHSAMRHYTDRATPTSQYQIELRVADGVILTGASLECGRA